MEPTALIGQNILGINKYMKLYLKTALKPHRLNTAEGMVLLALYSRDGKTQEEILVDIHQGAVGVTQEQMIDELHYDKGVMTRTMQALEQKGYVIRQENLADGRSFVFHLTPISRQFKPTLLGILRNWSNGTLSGLTGEQIAQLDHILRQMVENAKQTAMKGIL